MSVAALTCCCGGGEVCFAHYIDCVGGFGELSVRYPNGCPQVHPPVIYILAGDPNHRCFYFNGEVPSGIGAIINPDEILATFQNCEACADSDPPPPPTTGACCHGPEGTQCSDVTELECQQLNGNFFPGVDCSQVNCTTPIGACCYVEPGVGGVCVNTTNAQCNLLGGIWHPPPAVCANTQCQFPEGGESRGFGDTVAKLTSAFGIKPCAGCKQRQAALNRWLPYGKGGQAT